MPTSLEGVQNTKYFSEISDSPHFEFRYFVTLLPNDVPVKFIVKSKMDRLVTFVIAPLYEATSTLKR